MIEKLPQTYNTRYIYKSYTVKLKEEKSKLIDDIKTYNGALKNVLKKLKQYKQYIDDNCHTKYEDLLGLSRKVQVTLLRFKPISRIIQTALSPKHIRLWLETMVVSKLEILRINKRLDVIDNCLIKYDPFRFLVNEFNKEIIKAIVEKGYVFQLHADSGYNLGSILVVKKRRKKKPVNWNESNKIKEKLIEDGLTPYNKQTAPKGHKWLIYFDDEYGYYYHWTRYRVNVKGRSNYSFKPVKGDNSVIRKLYSHVRNNPLSVLNFKEFINGKISK